LASVTYLPIKFTFGGFQTLGEGYRYGEWSRVWLISSFFRLPFTNRPWNDFERATVSPNPKSVTIFNFIPALFSRNSAGSIYSPLSTADRTHQELDGSHDARTMRLRGAHSSNFHQSPALSLRSNSFLLRSPRKLFVNIKNICGRLLRPTTAEDKQRVEWICVNFSGLLTLG
jgi:hypothetical protein